MKELAFLMFIIGCGYVAIKLAARFSNTPIRRRHFAIPSQAGFNILWGFAFYLGFAALTAHHHWAKIISVISIICLMLIIIYRHALLRQLNKPFCPYFNRLFAKQLKQQQSSDMLLNQPYTRSEALAVLGLPNTVEDRNPLPAARLKLLENLHSSNPGLPYLNDLLPQLRNALSLK